jgi:hypothetical protein
MLPASDLIILSMVIAKIEVQLVILLGFLAFALPLWA